MVTKAQKEIQVSSDSSPPDRNHQKLPITQDLIHWIRTVARKKEFNDKELLAELGRFVYYDSNPMAPKILYWFYRGMLNGPKKSKMGFCYQIPSKGKFATRAYFSQKDPRGLEQEIAPKAENLTGSGFYQFWSEEAKRTVLGLGVAIVNIDDHSEIRGRFSIENGEIKLEGITFQGLLEALPRTKF